MNLGARVCTALMPPLGGVPRAQLVCALRAPLAGGPRTQLVCAPLPALVCVALASMFAVAQAQERFAGSVDLDRVIDHAIASKQIPGAVCIAGQAGQPGRLLHRKAYGSRALVPQVEPMTLDTVFDAASLTKVIATTSSVMRLFEQGKLRLNDPVTTYLPRFQGGKSDITVRQLLTHYSGMRPDLDLEPEWSGYEMGISKALVDKPIAAPGERFIYSDINFELLGEIVRVLSGKTLAEFASDEVFRPLSMKDTRFLPPVDWQDRIAPTEVLKGKTVPVRGIVHDPTARYMGGIAGHAGLFTTAADLSKFAQMMLNLGVSANGTRVFQAATIAKFTEPNSPPDRTQIRGLGWDIDTRYSANRGELFPVGSFGHTGFTGTSLWMDPKSKTYVILLTNSVHPKVGINISGLRGRVATIVAAHVGITGQEVLLSGYNELMTSTRRKVDRNGQVKTGLDMLVEQQFAVMAGRNVGLISNHTGIDRTGRRNVDRMIEAGVQLTTLFSPEHGFAGTEDKEKIVSMRDKATGLPVYSLYEDGRRAPTSEMLHGLDALVFDIQDIGARFYTYACTLQKVMELANQAGLHLYVLDRPNPITGVRVEGPILEKDFGSFVGCMDVPVRHGMTIGELAMMMKAEKGWKLNLTVVKMQGWQRGDWFDETGLPWINPSPNIRSLTAALLYPGVAMLEYSRNYTVGRGTDAPFEWVGADWIKGPELAASLNARQIPGVRFYPVRFKPESSNLEGIPVEGVRCLVTDREQFDAVRMGLEIGGALQRLYPGKIRFLDNGRLIGKRKDMEELQGGVDPRLIDEREDEELKDFLARRQKYLLY
ncbi:MAG: exo-beta-N-acetylmuramidase NamZ domain-containing protein [Acidobacteriota bacterium]